MAENPRITLINVAGVCHGLEKYARSPIHDKITNLLANTDFDIETVFIPSAEIQKDQDTSELIGIQHPPCNQKRVLCNVVKTAIQNSRIPIAIAHSSGSISTISALKDDILKNAVIISPTFLDPINEIFNSPAFKRRLVPVEQPRDKYLAMISPTSMNYSTLFPINHLIDCLYTNPILFNPESIEKIIKLINELRLRIFIGKHDWNQYSSLYPRIFDVETIEGETHSFEEQPESVITIASTIKKFINKVIKHQKYFQQT